MCSGVLISRHYSSRQRLVWGPMEVLFFVDKPELNSINQRLTTRRGEGRVLGPLSLRL